MIATPGVIPYVGRTEESVTSARAEQSVSGVSRFGGAL